MGKTPTLIRSFGTYRSPAMDGILVGVKPVSTGRLSSLEFVPNEAAAPAPLADRW